MCRSVISIIIDCTATGYKKGGGVNSSPLNHIGIPMLANE
jgi:hypothetical protein